MVTVRRLEFETDAFAFADKVRPETGFQRVEEELGSGVLDGELRRAAQRACGTPCAAPGVSTHRSRMKREGRRFRLTAAHRLTAAAPISHTLS